MKWKYKERILTIITAISHLEAISNVMVKHITDDVVFVESFASTTEPCYINT
jgi:hypothetical protein